MLRIRPRAFSLLCCSLAAIACAPIAAQAQQNPPVAGADAGPGIIAGQIFEEGSGFVLFGVRVEVDGLGLTAETDFTGNFRISGVPSGAQSLLLAKDGYQSLRISNLSVATGDVASINASLKPVDIPLPGVAGPTQPTEGDALGQPILLDVVSVDAEVLQASAADFVALRQQAVGAVDSISAEEFSKFVGSDVTDILGKIPGVSVARGQFAVIRGLSERYNATTLNGVQLPSADPERQSPQLDIFPTRLLDGIVVSKAFTPSLPGNASGGAIDLQTNAFPVKPETVLSLGLGIDEGLFSNDDFLTHETSGKDLFALGSQSRVRKPEVPSGSTLPDVPLSQTVPDIKKMPVGPRGSLYRGDTIPLDDSGRAFGYNIALTYDTSYSSQDTTVIRSAPNPGDLGLGIQRESLRFSEQESEANVQIGALGTLGYKFNNAHQVTATGFISQSGTDSVQTRDNFVDADGDFPTVPGSAPETFDQFEHRFQYQERNLSLATLSGRHAFEAVNGATADWSASYIIASQDEPDYRTIIYRRSLETGRFLVTGDSGAGLPLERFWRKTQELQRVYNLNWKQPFSIGSWQDLSLDFGGSFADAGRSYDELSVKYTRSGRSFIESPADFGGLVGTDLSINSVLPAESSAEREIQALHGLLTVPVGSKIKLSAGIRKEDTKSVARGIGRFGNFDSLQFYFFNPFLGVDIDGDYISEYVNTRFGRFNDQDVALTQGEIDQSDLLPAFLATISPNERTNLRLSYSRTIARPSFRELGSYFTFDPNDAVQHGNSNLGLSEVENWDARLEHFFEGSDLVALSVFAKRIENPIEKTTVDFPLEFDTWFNNPNRGSLKGVEIEVRKGLGFVSDSLSNFSVGGNLSLIDAEVRRPESELIAKQDGYGPGVPVPETRRLFDQPEWLVNTDLGYNNERSGTRTTLSLFMTSDVLDSVGRRTFDRYRKGYQQLDWTFNQQLTEHLRLRLTVKNITDPDRKRIYDPAETQGQIVERRWKEGRSYSASLTYEF